MWMMTAFETDRPAFPLYHTYMCICIITKAVPKLGMSQSPHAPESDTWSRYPAPTMRPSRYLTNTVHLEQTSLLAQVTWRSTGRPMRHTI